MASLALSAVCATAGTLVSTIKTHEIHSKYNKKQQRNINKQQSKLEETLMELIDVSSREKDSAEVRFFNFHEVYQVEQIKKEDDMNKIKVDIKNAKAERERLMETRHEQWERKQQEMIEAEQDHQRLLEAEAKEGLKRSHEEFPCQMALDRERLAKEDEFMHDARLEHYRCLEEERERFEQSKAGYKRAIEEDRKRMAHEMNIFSDAMKKWDNYKVMLEQIYDDIPPTLNEGYQQLRRDQQELDERFQGKLEDMTDFKEELKLKDLTETFLDSCNLHSIDPDHLTKKTEIFQRDLTLQLNKVKNSMTSGDMSLFRLDVWKDGAVLNLKILGYLYSIGGIQPETIRNAGKMYLNDMDTLVSNFNASYAIPCSRAELRAIGNSFHDQVQEMQGCIDRALPEPTSISSGIQAPTATESSILSPSRTECALAEGSVSAASRGGHLKSEILTESDDASQLPASDNWASAMP